MADDGNLDVGFGLDTSRANVELQRLKSQLDGVSANLLQAQRVIETKTAKMVTDLTSALGRIEAGTANYTRRIQSLESNIGRGLGSAARGGLFGQQRDAAARAIIADARNSAEQVTARITNELVSQYTQRIKAMDQMVAARLRATSANAARFQANNSPEMLAAKQILDKRRRQDTLYEATYGRGALANKNTLERLGSNGGADIVAVQSRLLLGYAGLSAVFNGIRGISQYIVDLDKELKNFQSITAATNSEMALLRDRFNQTAEASHFSSLEIAKAATILGQAGLSAREVADSIGAISKLATASGSDLASAVDVVTSSMSVFDLQAGQAVDIANTLTSALNLSKLTVDKVALGIQYSGQIAAQSNVSFEELVATLGALSNSGIRSGSTLGTGLRQLLIDLQSPSAKLTKILKELDLTQQDVDISSNGLIPVINALRDAGFGASQAFEGLETRAAAAYLSLSANTDEAEKLRQQFALSNAATDANDVQMGSLSNTYDRFRSIVGSITSTALQPFINVMQQVLKVAGDVLAELNKYPVVLQAIGVGVGALSVALTVRMIIPLVKAIPLLFGFAGAASGVESAVGGLGASLLGLGGVGGPLVLVAAGVTALALAWDAFVPKAQNAAERIDALQGLVNQLGGEADTTKDRIGSINNAIDTLIKQKAALDKDPLLKNSKITELVSQFNELASSVKLGATSVDDLIDALRRLAQGDFTNLATQLETAINADNDLLNTKRGLLIDQTNSAKNPILNALGQFVGPTGEINRNLSSIFSDALGPRFGELADIGLGFKPFPTDATAAAQIGADLAKKSSELQNQQSTLLLKRRGGNITPEEVETLNKIPDWINLLDVLSQALQPMVETTRSISQTEFDKSSKTAELLKARIQGSAAYGDLLKESDSILKFYTAAYGEFGRSEKGQTIEERASKLSALREELNKRVAALDAKTSSTVTDLAKELGADPEQVKDAVNALSSTGRLGKLRAEFTDKDQSLSKLLAKFVSETLGNEIDTVNSNLDLVKKQAKDAYTREQLNAFQDEARRLFDAKRKLLKEIFDKQSAATDDPTELASLEQKLRQDQRQLDDDERAAMGGFADDAIAVYRRELDARRAGIDDEIDASKTKMSMLLESMRKLKPGKAFDALRTQFDTVANQLSALEHDANALDLVKNMGAQGTSIPRTSAANASTAMQYFVGKGLSQVQASGLVGRLLVESGLYPGAVGDGGKARGIMQAHPDRWARFTGDPTSLQDQLDFIWQELNSTEGAAFGKLKTAQTPEEASAAALAYERPSGYSAAHPENSLGYSDTVANAYALNQGSYSSTLADAAKTTQDVVQVTADSALKGVKATVNEAVKAANERISTLVTQSKNLSDPAQVQSIIHSVNDQYQKVIDEKTKLFDQQNLANADDPDVAAQRDQMLAGLRADQQQKISGLLDAYWAAIEKKTQELVDTAQGELDAAQLPQNANRFTGAQIQTLQNNVTTAQQAADAQRLAGAKSILQQIDLELANAEATYGKNSAEASAWLNEEAAAVDRVTQLQRQKNQVDAAAAQQGPSVLDGIKSATQAYLEQAGVLDAMGNLVPVAKQVESAWGGILDNLTTGFSTLFTDLVSGTMSATDAFRKFGLNVVQYLMQVIAKALALKIITAAFGLGGTTGGGSGGGLGDLLGALFGSNTGLKLGRAALGTAVPGRDSVPSLLMPGEVVLRQSAVSAIGQDTLRNLNNLGNRRLANGINQLPSNDNKQPSVTNVWVVSPDQQPASLGPNDVVAVVSRDIQNRGSIKQLIKQVVNGSI